MRRSAGLRPDHDESVTLPAAAFRIDRGWLLHIWSGAPGQPSAANNGLNSLTNNEERT